MSESGETLITLIAIFLAAILMFVFPMMAISENQDSETQAILDVAAQEFVTAAARKGEITEEDYEAFCSKIGATGNTYDIQIEVQHLDENHTKKYVITSGDLIGENDRISEFTNAILTKLENNGSYELKKGDNIIVTLKNKSTTMAELYDNFIYKLSGKDTAKLETTASSMVN